MNYALFEPPSARWVDAVHRQVAWVPRGFPGCKIARLMVTTLSGALLSRGESALAYRPDRQGD